MILPARSGAFLTALALSGCAASGIQSPPSAAGLTLVPEEQGLGVAPLGQEIGFGRHRKGAVAAVTRILGEAPGASVSRAPCSADMTAVSWPRAGLVMFFEGETFVGWEAGGGKVYPDPPRQAGLVCGPP